VLITGGLGFIGSNIAHRMVDLGADVTIMDSKIEGLGANDFNIGTVRGQVRLSGEDIRDPKAVAKNVRGADIVFDLAAQVDYKLSNAQPSFDSSINLRGHENIIDACADGNLGRRVVFPGSRTQYGRVKDEDLPVREDHHLETISPPSVYTANKTAIEMRIGLSNKHQGLNGVVLRLTNPFGPRAQIHNPSYCVLNWFIGQALQGKELTVFGNGKQLRDYVFINDVVDAFLVAGLHPNPESRIYNVGSGQGISFKHMAEKVAELTGATVKNVPYPEKDKGFETGHFYADVSRAKRELGWEPKTSLEEGLRRTVQYYRDNLGEYVKN